MNRVAVVASALALAIGAAGGFVAGRITAPPPPLAAPDEAGNEEKQLRREANELGAALDKADAAGDEPEARRLSGLIQARLDRLRVLAKAP